MKAFLLVIWVLFFLGCSVLRTPYILDMQERYSHEDFIQDELILTDYEYKKMYNQMNNMLGVYKEIRERMESSSFTKRQLSKIDCKKASITLNEFSKVYKNRLNDSDRALQSTKHSLFFSKKVSIRTNVSSENISLKQVPLPKDSSSLKKEALTEKNSMFKEFETISPKMDKIIEASKKLQKLVNETPFTKEQLRGFYKQEVYDVSNKSIVIYKLKGNFTKALEFAKNALFFSKLLSEENKQTIQAYNDISIIYLWKENYSDALKYANKAIHVSKEILNDKSTLLATSYYNKSVVYRSMNEYSKAITTINKAIVALKKTSKNQVSISKYYEKLSELHKLNKEDDLSLKYSKKASSEITNNDYATALNYQAQGNYPKAIELQKKILFEAEKELGKEHYIVASQNQKIASLYVFMKKPSKALSYATKAVQGFEKNFGKKSAKTARAYTTLYTTYLLMNNINKAYWARKISVDIMLHLRESLFVQLSNKSKANQLSMSEFQIEDFIYMGFMYQEKNYKQRKEIAKEVFNTWLQYKGSIGNSEAYLIALKSKTQDHTLKSKINQLIALKTNYSHLFFKQISNSETFTKKEKEDLKKLKVEQDLLEIYLSSQMATYKATLKLKNINSYQISQKLKKDELYIDFIHITQHNHNRYVGFMVNHKNEVQLSLLNRDREYGSIETLVKEFRAKIEAKEDTDEIGNNLYKILFSSLLNKHNFYYNLTDYKKTIYKKLIISPDGILNTLPFEALTNNLYEYLIEKYSISYVSSGKEFLKAHQEKDKLAKNNKLILLSNLNYNDNALESLPTSNKEQTKSIDNIFHKWRKLKPLKSGQTEANFMQELYKKKDIVSYTKNEGTKKLLYSLNSPKDLHLSTHSFYGKDNDNTIDSLLKSAIALSGYNAILSMEDNRGIMTALEFSTLNLLYTELVFFSSCESGLGDIYNSEGVEGLAKSAKIAGAKRVISTLWAVPDKETSELTKRFYGYLYKDKLGYLNALKQSKLDMLHLHPYYWAGFIEYGLD